MTTTNPGSVTDSSPPSPFPPTLNYLDPSELGPPQQNYPALVDLNGLLAAFDGFGLKLPRKTLLKWAQEGKIPSVCYAGRRRLYSVPAVEDSILRMASARV